MMQDALLHLDNDKQLAESMLKANDVLLGMYFELGEPQGKPDNPLPDYILKNNLTNIKGRRRTPPYLSPHWVRNIPNSRN